MVINLISLKSNINKVISQNSFVGVALKMPIIVFLVVTSLTAAFTQSEEGQEKLQRGLKMMGAVVKNVMDAFADLGEGIIDAITKPQQAWKSFKDGFKKFIFNEASGLFIFKARVRTLVTRFDIYSKEHKK